MLSLLPLQRSQTEELGENILAIKSQKQDLEPLSDLSPKTPDSLIWTPVGKRRVSIKLENDLYEIEEETRVEAGCSFDTKIFQAEQLRMFLEHGSSTPKLFKVFVKLDEEERKERKEETAKQAVERLHLRFASKQNWFEADDDVDPEHGRLSHDKAKMKDEEKKLVDYLLSKKLIEKDESYSKTSTKTPRALPDIRDTKKLIMEDFLPLMINKESNNLCALLLKVATEEDIKIILVEIAPLFREMIINRPCHRILMELIEVVRNQGSEDNTHAIIDILKQESNALLEDNIGPELLGKILQDFDRDQIGFVVDFVIEKFATLSTTRRGCCLLRKCFRRCTATQEVVLKNLLCDYLDAMMVHPFGNYVIQYLIGGDKVLDHNWLHAICEKFYINDSMVIDAGRLIYFCANKYSSNVMEGIINAPPSEEIQIPLIKKMVDFTVLRVLLKHEFGNYVIQKAVHYLENKPNFDEVLDGIASVIVDNDAAHLPMLRWKLFTTFPVLRNHPSVENIAQRYHKNIATPMPLGNKGTLPYPGHDVKNNNTRVCNYDSEMP